MIWKEMPLGLLNVRWVDPVVAFCLESLITNYLRLSHGTQYRIIREGN